VYRSVEYRVTGVAAVDATTGARTAYASTADAVAAGHPPDALVASLVPALRLLPRFDRPGRWPVEVGVTDARLLSFKADIAASFAVTVALAASFLTLGVVGPSAVSVYVVNSASMAPTVAVGDALVVEKVSLRGVVGGGVPRAAAAAAAEAPAVPPLGAEGAGASADAGAWRAGSPPPGPRVGEVVLFHPPAALRQRAAADGTVLRAKDAFVKRVVAVAGDTVEVRGGVVTVNGVVVEAASWGTDRGGAAAPGAAPAAPPSADGVATPSAATAIASLSAPQPARPVARRGAAPPSAAGAPPPDRRTVVGDRQLYVLGDNAAHSCDSRYWGLLPVADVVGRPVARMWPLGRAAVTRLERGAEAAPANPGGGGPPVSAAGAGGLWPPPLPPP